ncbi:hypothetical protein RclHR1_08230006 [Rhizophagus clarus]|uniref:Uncharacterized protein n=1 Tax=Rhizophagus clarus TaxID=94130 RepID=A0A2Z6SBC6_9GLOM|nr:hypothetical protein RclHR1_08230006 [Rhizophagus clarus]GES95540.1 hypothetical protein GLOIN_2v1872386 [Rhizophagus clarus]
MTASFLLSECLERIFLYLVDGSGDTLGSLSAKSLYSCALVSRHWCRISTPFLYAYPFHYVIYSDSHISKIFQLIRTLLNCIPKSDIELIINSKHSHIHKLFFRSNKKSPSLSPYSSTFNYITFIRGLIFNETLLDSFKLYHYRKIWLPPYIPKNNTTQRRFTKISIPIMNYLLKFLCKNCNNLQILEFLFTLQDNDFFNSIIDLLTFKDRNGRSKLSNLKKLNYISKYEDQKDLYLALSNDICNLSLLRNEGINSIEKANSISKFISLQKKLRYVILSERYHCIRNSLHNNYNIVLNSLSTQCESLQKLDFTNLSFGRISEEALNSLCSLKNIRELKLYECKELDDHLIPWAVSLTKLEIFKLILDDYTNFSKDFLIKIIQSSSDTLIKLIINYGRLSDQDCQLFKQISICSHSLIYLELPKIFPNELISIFKSCDQLNYLSVILSDYGDCSLRKKDFKNFGKFIPKKLEEIQFKVMNNVIFNSDDLKLFFEECVNNGSELKRLEISGKLDRMDISQDYYDVAREFGVQFAKRRSMSLLV